MDLPATAKIALRRSWRALPAPARSTLLRGIFGTLSEIDKFAAGVPTVHGLLLNVRAAGFTPRTVIDVGANVGNWSRMSAATTNRISNAPAPRSATGPNTSSVCSDPTSASA